MRPRSRNCARCRPRGNATDIAEDIGRLETKAAQALRDLYAELTPWQKTQVARHPQRPHCLDYIQALFRSSSRSPATASSARTRPSSAASAASSGESICVIGHEKGSSTESRLKHNFGMARPEGYRKAVRLMEMADRFDIPVLALIDTAGAYPGIDAEERGQAEAIARSTDACLNLGVPNVAVILGEGGSGGAVAIATANRVLMLEHAIYSVISPEGAASILWRDTTKAQDAATNMKITASRPHGVRHHRRHRHRADRRRPSRSGRRHRGHRRGGGQALSPNSRGSTAKPCGGSAATSSWPSGGGSNRRLAA